MTRKVHFSIFTNYFAVLINKYCSIKPSTLRRKFGISKIKTYFRGSCRFKQRQCRFTWHFFFIPIVHPGDIFFIIPWKKCCQSQFRKNNETASSRVCFFDQINHPRDTTLPAFVRRDRPHLRSTKINNPTHFYSFCP